MKFSMRVKFVLALSVMVVMCASSAWGYGLFVLQGSETFVRDGKIDYRSARFTGYDVFVNVEQQDLDNFVDDESNDYFKFDNGETPSFSYRDSSGNIISYAGNYDDFKWERPIIVGNNWLILKNADGTPKSQRLGFLGEAETSFSGKTVSWAIGDSVDGFGQVGLKLMDFLPINEQIKEDVVNIEINDDIVKYTILLPYSGRMRVWLRNANNEDLDEFARDIEFVADVPVEGEFVLSSSTDFNRVIIRIEPAEGRAGTSRQRYFWTFRIIPDGPSDTPANTTSTFVNPPSNNERVSRVGIIVTDVNDPIPQGLRFVFWLIRNTVNNQSTINATTSTQSAISTTAVSDAIGPFGATSQEGGILNIDVNNLRNPDGSPSSVRVPSGSFVIRAESVDGDTAYVVETNPVDLLGNETSSSSGGCNVGFGFLITLALMGFVVRGYSKK